MSNRTTSRLLLFLILSVAAVLRLRGLGAHDVWYDECCSIHIAKQPLNQVLPTIESTENTPPLYYLLLWGWLRLTHSDAAVAMRLPSVAFGIASVGATYFLGRALAPSRRFIALISAALMAVSPMVIWYSRDARAYPLLVLLSLLSTSVFLKWTRRRSPALSIVYVTLAVALLYTHLYGGATILAHGIALLLTRGIASPRKRDVSESSQSLSHELTETSPLLMLLGLAMVSGCAFLFYLPALTRWSRRVNGFWIPPVTLDDISATLREFASSSSSALVISFFALIAMVMIVRRRLQVRRDREAAILLASMFVLNVIVPVIGSILRNPLYLPRYGIAAMPILFLATSFGIAQFTHHARWIGGLMAAVVIAMIASGVPPEAKPDFRPAARYLAQSMKRGDTVVMTPKDETVLYDYHVRRPDIPRHGFFTTLPFDRALRLDEHVWLLSDRAQDVASAVLRSNLRVVSQRKFNNIIVIELASADESHSTTRPISN